MDEDLNSYFINLEWYNNNVDIDKICNRLLNHNNSNNNNDNNNNNNNDMVLFFYDFIIFLYNKKDQYQLNSNHYIKIKSIVEKFGCRYEFFIIQNYKDYIYSNYKKDEIGALFIKLLVDNGLFNNKVDYYDYYMMINNNLDLIKCENGLDFQIISNILNHFDLEKKKTIHTLYLFFSIVQLVSSTLTLESSISTSIPTSTSKSTSISTSTSTFDQSFKDRFLDAFITYFSNFLSSSCTTSFKRERNGIDYIVLASKNFRSSNMLLEFEECKLIATLRYLVKILEERKKLATDSLSKLPPVSSLSNKQKKELKSLSTKISFYNSMLLGLFEIFNSVQNQFKSTIQSIINTNQDYIVLQSRCSIQEYINLLLENGLFRYKLLGYYFEDFCIKDLLMIREIPNRSMPLFKLIIVLNNMLSNFPTSPSTYSSSSTSSNASSPTLINNISRKRKNSFIDNGSYEASNLRKAITSFSCSIDIKEIKCIFYNSFELESNISGANSRVSAETIESFYLNLYFRIKNNYSIESCLDSLFYKIQLCNHKLSFVQSILNDLVVDLELNFINQYIVNIPELKQSLENNIYFINKKRISNHYHNNNHNNSSSIITNQFPNYIFKNILHYLIVDSSDQENALLFIEKLNLSLVCKLFFKLVSELMIYSMISMDNRVLSRKQVNLKWSLFKVESIRYLNIKHSPSPLTISPQFVFIVSPMHYNKSLDNLVWYSSLEIIEFDDGSFCKSIFSDFIYLLKHPTLKTIILNCKIEDVLHYYRELQYYSNFKQFKFKLSFESESFAPIVDINSVISIAIPTEDFIHEYFKNDLHRVQNYIVRDSIISDQFYRYLLPGSENSHQLDEKYQFYLERINMLENLSKLTFEDLNNDSMVLFLKFISGRAVNLSELVIIPLSLSICVSSIFHVLSSGEINLPSLVKVTLRTKNNYSLSYNNWHSLNSTSSFKSLDHKYKSFYKLNNHINNSNNSNNSNKGSNKDLVWDYSFNKIKYLEINSETGSEDENLYYFKQKYPKVSIASIIGSSDNTNDNKDDYKASSKSLDKYEFHQQENEFLDFYPTSFTNNKFSIY